MVHAEQQPSRKMVVLPRLAVRITSFASLTSESQQRKNVDKSFLADDAVAEESRLHRRKVDGEPAAQGK
jgi:hypothetical protein